MNNKNSSPNVLLFGLGLAAGWLIKQLFDSPEGRAKREQAMATVDNLRERLMDLDESGRVKEVFGEVTKEATQTYKDAREQLVTELGELKVSFDDLDKTKYLKIVGNVIKSVKEDQKLPEAQLGKLQTALKSDFRKLQSDYQDRHPEVEEAEEAVKKVKTKVARKVAKVKADKA